VINIRKASDEFRIDKKKEKKKKFHNIVYFLFIFWLFFTFICVSKRSLRGIL